MTRREPAEQEAPGRVSPTAPKSKSLSAAVWGYLEGIPGFNEDLRQSRADLEAGKGTPFKEVRRGR